MATHTQIHTGTRMHSLASSKPLTSLTQQWHLKQRTKQRNVENKNKADFIQKIKVVVSVLVNKVGLKCFNRSLMPSQTGMPTAF